MPGGRITDDVTKPQLEAMLDDEIATREQSSDLTVARTELHRMIREDIGWWYKRCRWLAEHGDSKTDQVKAQAVKMIFDKVAPDLKALQRGGVSPKAAAQVNLHLGDKGEVSVTDASTTKD